MRRMTLEKMKDFFENRIEEYDDHMLNEIDSANEFYPFTAELLPKSKKCRLLDLGCGTGLELEFYFRINHHAEVIGIDLSDMMLAALRSKFPEKKLNLICGSYFDFELGNDEFDCAVSVESLHHFTKIEKVSLYKKLRKSLKNDGYFILTDYFSLSDEEEIAHRQNFIELKKKQGITGNELYHYDTPLTVEHEIEALTEAGFTTLEVVKNWGATYTLKAIK